MHSGNFCSKSLSITVLSTVDVTGCMRAAEETEARFAGLCSLVTLSDPPFPSVRLDLDKKLSIPGCLDSGAFLLLMNKDKLSPVSL